MLLRSVSENLKSQNWTAIGLDFVIVVVGIFLGLQASQWYEHRQEFVLGKSILQRLQGEFETISAEARSAFRFHQEEVTALEVVRQALIDRSLDSEHEARFLAGLRDAMSYDLGPSRSGTYIEILSSGQFRLLRDPALRTALNDYDDDVQKADSLFSIFQQNQRKHEFVFGRHFHRRPSQEHDFESTPTGIMISHGEIADYDLDAMANDEEFVSAIARLIEYHINFQFWHGKIYRSADRVLRLLDSSDP